MASDCRHTSECETASWSITSSNWTVNYKITFEHYISQDSSLWILSHTKGSRKNPRAQLSIPDINEEKDIIGLCSSFFLFEFQRASFFRVVISCEKLESSLVLSFDPPIFYTPPSLESVDSGDPRGRSDRWKTTSMITPFFFIPIFVFKPLKGVHLFRLQDSDLIKRN